MNAQVDVQTVIQILSNRIANLATENAVLQARNVDLEQQIKQMREQLDKAKDHKKEEQPA